MRKIGNYILIEYPFYPNYLEIDYLFMQHGLKRRYDLQFSLYCPIQLFLQRKNLRIYRLDGICLQTKRLL